MAHDPVNHPSHYTSHPSGIECITVTRYMGFNLGNVVKYLWRAGLKDRAPTLQDLKKARWYLDDEIKQLEKAEAAKALKLFDDIPDIAVAYAKTLSGTIEAHSIGCKVFDPSPGSCTCKIDKGA